MKALAAVAFVLTGMMLAMQIYVKSHPPEASEAGVLSLKRGLRLGIVSSIAILALFTVMLFFPPVSRPLLWPLTVIGLVGNALNLFSLIYCLREFTGESLFVACLLALTQLLWVVYTIRAMTVDF